MSAIQGEASTVADRLNRIPAGKERRDAVELLSQAFRDNPLNAAVIAGGPGRRLRTNRHGMRTLLAAAAAPEGGAWVLSARRETLAGLLIAAPPLAFPLPPPPLGLQLRALLGQGWRTQQRWSKVYRALEAVHPLSPHWYLAVLGVEPRHQRQGVGRELLSRFGARVDAERMPGYLETDRRENVAYYGGAGFEVVRQVQVLDVPVWCMWRPARR